jgi:AcrR family transcriptional regulator
MNRRVAPLTPDARRASIIAATLPLLRTYGASVTTAQIAMAAGVAEGTLFRAFPDKDALIAAALHTAFDPAVAEAQLQRIDRTLPLRDQLVAAVEILQRRVEQIWQLMAVMGIPMLPPRSSAEPERDAGIRRELESIFVVHVGELCCEPAYAMRILRMMTLAGTHPRITDNLPLTAAEIVGVVLDGIRTRDHMEA